MMSKLQQEIEMNHQFKCFFEARTEDFRCLNTVINYNRIKELMNNSNKK